MPIKLSDQSTLQNVIEALAGNLSYKQPPEYLQAKSVNDKTRKNIIRMLRSISPDFLGLPIADITPDHLTDIVSRTQQKGEYLAELLIQGLRFCFRLAYHEGIIPVNPMDHVHFRLLPSDWDCFSESQYQTLLELFRKQPGGIMYGLSAFLDIPMSEASSILREDCFPETNTVLVKDHRKKIKKELTLYENDGVELLRLALLQYDERMSNKDCAANNPEHCLFISKNGFPYTDKEIFTISNNIFYRAQIPYFSLSVFRKYLRMRHL